MIVAADVVEPSRSFVRTVDSTTGLDTLRVELHEMGIFMCEIDGSTIASDEKLFDAISQAFRFPDYFGRNWDALIDCLRDLEWLAEIGYVVVIHNAVLAFQRTPATMARFIELCGDVASFWAENKRPFHLVLFIAPEERP